MLISEIFPSLQGEGAYIGYPVIFVRLSGCTRKCRWCDTKYHKEGKSLSISYVAHQILMLGNKYNISIVIFTGGEPLLQVSAITEVINEIRRLDGIFKYVFHLETNGDLFSYKYLDEFPTLFNYICFSPKSRVVVSRLDKELKELSKKVHIDSKDGKTSIWKFPNYDIKVVTDLRTVNAKLLPFATILMPLTTYNVKKDRLIKKRVWDYCLKHGLRYSPRIHVDVFRKKRRV